jgi:hypothetical protein
MFQKVTLTVFASAAVLFAADLPTPEAVFNKSIEATGGRASYERVHAMLTKGSVEIAGQGIKGGITVVEAAPDRSVTTMEFEGLGRILTGTGDGIAWQSSAMQGSRLLDGEEREQSLRGARMDSMLHWREVYGEVKVEGEDVIDGKPCWRLVAMPPKASKPETMWFDKKSGLQVKSLSTLVTAMGELPIESLYQEYQDAGGIKVPRVLRQSMGPQTMITTITEVKVNPDLPEGTFDVPPEIKALLAKK